MIQTCIDVKSNTERSQTLILKQRNFLNMKNCVLIDYLIIILFKYLLTAYQEDQHAKRREKLLKNTKHSVALADDPVHNDYKREMLFYRQAQATVIESLARLKNMGLPTKRPDDYFAQMMKSDDHMQKIRTKLAQKQEEEERVQKVRKLRELKKFGKQVQVEVQQKRHKEKREMMEQVKQFRKGKSDKIDFLDEIEATKGKKKFDPKQQSQHDKTKGYAAAFLTPKSVAVFQTNLFSSSQILKKRLFLLNRFSLFQYRTGISFKSLSARVFFSRGTL